MGSQRVKSACFLPLFQFWRSIRTCSKASNNKRWQEGKLFYFFINDWCSQLANIQRPVPVILDSSVLSLILSVFCLGLFLQTWSLSNLFLFSGTSIKMKADEIFKKMDSHIMSTWTCASFFYLLSSLINSVPTPITSALTLSPRTRLSITLVTAVCKTFCLVTFRMIKYVNVCFSSSLQDSDRAAEAARGGRSGGWNRGSSSYRDQRHLRQGTTLQQRYVSMCVSVSLYRFEYKHTKLM